jgi:t-SNARE complex subunit (syntaxin)
MDRLGDLKGSGGGASESLMPTEAPPQQTGTKAKKQKKLLKDKSIFSSKIKILFSKFAKMIIIKPHTEFMKEFFVDVGRIKQNLSRMRTGVSEVSQLHQEHLSKVMSKEAAEEHKSRLDTLTDQTEQLGRTTAAQLKAMKDDNDRIVASSAGKPSEIQARSNMHGMLARKFVEVMQEFQEVIIIAHTRQ